MSLSRLIALIAYVLLTACASPRTGMVAAAHPLAAEAGVRVLKEGGSAADAAIAVQAVLGLVEPQASGFGGGAFLLYWDAKARKLDAYDGRETAPAAATPRLFLDPKGKPLAFLDAAKSGRSVGVPGVVALLELARADHGKLGWAKALAPAIKLSEGGFEVSPHLHDMIARTPALDRHADTRALYFAPDGEPLAVGAVIRNPAYAATLRSLADDGPRAFYDGAIAEGIVAAVTGAADRPGAMTREDLRRYAAKRRAALCAPYRAVTICTMPPPAGGVTLLEFLKLAEFTDLSALDPRSAEAAHRLAEASDLAYADRERYVADPDHVAVPTEGLLDPAYLRTRAGAIGRVRHSGPAKPGTPPGAEARADVAAEEVPSTSHFVIVDSDGNIASMTTSVEMLFGSNLMTGGFILNNQLTDFSFVPSVNGQIVANAPAPGKRPRSGMSPTIVFDGGGAPILALGSPGGGRIISYVAQTLMGVLDWKRPLQDAIEMPHSVAMNKTLELEANTDLARLAPALAAMGHEVKVTPLMSGLQGVALTAAGLQGGADPRREGVAIPVSKRRD